MQRRGFVAKTEDSLFKRLMDEQQQLFHFPEIAGGGLVRSYAANDADAIGFRTCRRVSDWALLR